MSAPGPEGPSDDELRAWALRILAGASLDDKLARDGGGWRGDAPREPGRPAGLTPRAGRARFPSGRELATAEGRGRALHFFANHELMALELM
ncbi:MAG TPA: hypothetical protein PKA64_20605, partial [Myxococcota bacterium]|nr:hypothetical protein [Myxococcota bacterium]